jgi:RND family efflux transporter MFP subunit
MLRELSVVLLQFIPTLRTVTAVIGLVMLSMLASCDRQQQTSPKKSRPLPKVVVGKPLSREILEWDEYTGRFAAIDRVQVRARVSGYLEAVKFKDGSRVNKGDLLFVVDPRPFEAALRRAQGEKQRAKARLELAEIRLGRSKDLLEENAVSQDAYDERLAETRQARAEFEALEAAVTAAELDLEFTEVRSPVKGTVSNNFVTVGNLISGGNPNSTLLTTIVSTDPIYFYFDVDERTYLKYLHLAREGKRRSSRTHPNPVLARLAHEDAFEHKGRMDFVDNRIDPDTATLRGRAVFRNPDGILLPGMFARVRVPGSNRYQAILIPGKAVGRDQARRFVYVLDKDNTVTRRPVTLGPRACGLRVAASGLSADDTVVLEGLPKIRPGDKVNPSQGSVELSSRTCLAAEYEEIFENETSESKRKSDSSSHGRDDTITTDRP